MDMNPLAVPPSMMTDCLNGTLITYNGNEMTLQNDGGNVRIEQAQIPNGFIPVGMKEYGGIIYMALLNPETNQCQIGSLPAPSYDSSPAGKNADKPIEYEKKIPGSSFNTHFTKLFEFDELELNPGDKYKILYQVSTKDISGLYSVKWLAIDEEGKRFELENPNIVPNDSGQYKYFDQTIKAILGLEVSLNNIDLFDISAFEQINTSDNKSITLKLYGKNKINLTNKSYGSYTELEYLEGTGTQWINTALKTTDDSEVEIQFSFTEEGTKAIYGARTEFNHGVAILTLNSTNMYHQFSAQSKDDFIIENINDDSIITAINNINTCTFIIDGQDPKIYTNFKSDKIGVGDIYLFTTNKDGSGADSRCFVGKIYSYKHYRNGVLVQNLIPVLDPMNTPCMYDTLSQMYLYNSGKNEFLYKIKESSGSEDELYNNSLYIRGCKVDYSILKNNGDLINDNFYIWSDSPIADKFQHAITDLNFYNQLNEKDVVQVNVTPFTQYQSLTDLTRSLSLKMGDSVVSENMNNYFQYFYDKSNKNLKLEFDMNVVAFNNPYMYVEFYDLWSDYSVIIPVEDPNPMGKNLLHVDVVEEPCVNNYSSSNGGVPHSQISTWVEEDQNKINRIYKPFFSNKYRPNQKLRANNMYIVRISAIEYVDEVPVYNDVIKLFILNDNMNSIYDQLKYNDYSGYNDFSVLTQPKINPLIESVINNSTKTLNTSQINNLDLITTYGDVFYAYSLDGEGIETGKENSYITKYDLTENVDMKVNISTPSGSYGLFSSELTNIEKVSDNLIITNEDYTVASSADLSILNINNDLKTFNILQSLNTERKIVANITKDVKYLKFHNSANDISLWDTIYGTDNYPTGISVKFGSHGNVEYPRDILDYDTSTVLYKKDHHSFDDYTMGEVVKTLQSKNSEKQLSGIIAYWKSYKFNGDQVWLKNSSGTVLSDNVANNLVFLYNATKNGYYPAYINNYDNVIKILKSIKTAEVNTRDVNLYYYSGIINNNVSTSYLKTDVTINVSTKCTISQNIKKLDVIDGTALRDLPNMLNNIITQSIPEEQIVSKGNINVVSGYYNILAENSITNSLIQLPIISVLGASDTSVLEKIRSGKTDMERIEASNLVDSLIEDKSVFFDSGETAFNSKYGYMTKKFTVDWKTTPKFSYEPGYSLNTTLWAVEGKGDRNDATGFSLYGGTFDD